MKAKIFLTAFLIVSIASKGESVKSVKASVSKATVYLNGAMVTCTTDLQVQPGINQIVFEGVSPSLDANSLQANAKGNVVLMDVKFQTKFREAQILPKQNSFAKALKTANDSLVLLDFEIESLNNELDNLNTEKNVLLNNKLIKGDGIRDTLPSFKSGLTYLRERLSDINAQSILIKTKLHHRNESRALLNERISALSTINQPKEDSNEAINTVVVMVNADVVTAAQITVSFFVSKAAWLPTYDLRATNNGKLDLTYKAEVRQTTGMDWTNVDLTLSTMNPNQSTAKPVLNPYYLTFLQAYKKKYMNETVPGVALQSAREEDSKAKDEIRLDDALNLYDVTTATEGMLQTEYDIQLKYSIPSGDEMRVVSIKNKNLSSQFKYSAIPKLDGNAFLLAELNDWNEMNLIPGTSRLYFDGSFIGKSVISPDMEVDTMVVSLGRDRSIMMNRKKLKDKTKVRTLADEKTVSITYEITLRNNKSCNVTIDVSDQIPISNDPSIKVELTDGNNATLNADTGELTWNVNVKAKETKKIKFTYEVKMPKDRSLAGL